MTENPVTHSNFGIHFDTGRSVFRVRPRLSGRQSLLKSKGETVLLDFRPDILCYWPAPPGLRKAVLPANFLLVKMQLTS